MISVNFERKRLRVDRSSCYQVNVEKADTQCKYTIWTAPASQEAPLLVQLDLRAPISGVSAARKRAESAKVRTKKILRYFVSRSTAASLRKLVK